MSLVFLLYFVEKVLKGQQPVFPAGHKDVEMLRWEIAVTVLEAPGG